MAEIIDVGQVTGKITEASGSGVGPGEVRSEIRVSFGETMRELTGLVSRVEKLARQAEDYFWQVRYSELSVNSINFVANDIDRLKDATGIRNAINGAWKLCIAAHPMLNEILERLSYVCGRTFYELGSEDGVDPTIHGDTYWLRWTAPGVGETWINPLATQTFYYPTAMKVCASLKTLLSQLNSWSRNTDDFDSVVTIQSFYSAALVQIYHRARDLINQLGPLWAPVVCNYSPYVPDTVETVNNAELFFPTSCTAEPLDTHRIELSFWLHDDLIPFGTLLKTASGNFKMTDEAWAIELQTWAAEQTTVAGSNVVYRSQGGLCAIDLFTGSGGTVEPGIYEVLAVGDTLILNNERIQLDMSYATETTELDDITFRIRMIRKARHLTEIDGVEQYVNVQYRASLDKLGEGDEDQNFSWLFSDAAENQHTTPNLTLPEGYSKQQFPIWLRYDVDTHSGTKTYCNSVLENVTKDTLFLDSIWQLYGFNGQVHCFAVDASGNLYVGGAFTQVNDEVRNHIAKINADGSLSTWDANASSNVFSLCLSSDGATLYAGGTFNTIGDETRFCLAAIDTTTGLANEWDPKGDWFNGIFCLALDSTDTTLYVGGLFISIGGASRKNIAALDTATGVATGWNPNANREVTCFALDSAETTIYVGGRFSSIGGVSPLNCIAALDTATGLANATWNPNANNRVYGLVLDSTDTTLYVCGEFTSIGGQSRRTVAALSTVGVGLATTWNPNPNLTVNDLALNSTDTTLYVGGLFTTIGGASRNCIAALHTTGEHAGESTDWNPNANGCVRTLLCNSDDTNVYVGGEFMQITPSSAITTHCAFRYNSVVPVYTTIPWEVPA